MIKQTSIDKDMSISQLKSELDVMRINMDELKQTNYHLISATWRERELRTKLNALLEKGWDYKKHMSEENSTAKNTLSLLKQENEKLSQELEAITIMLAELETTNSHLISATWRERELKQELHKTIEELSLSKKTIENQNDRIEEGINIQKLIEAQKNKIEESINYAERIQKSILPNEQDICDLFSDSFMFFVPRDKVSGDFPWLHKTDKYTFISVVDCTGHGVPGAFMSLIGHFLLNGIACNVSNVSPGNVLDMLHEAIVKTLKQETNPESRDGMDVGMCMIDNEHKKLYFAGAHRSLILIRNNELIEFKGDKRPIGGTQYRNVSPFVNHEINIEEGDTFYTFSDGLPDQFGGKDFKKLMNSGVKRILEENNHKNMSEIKEQLSAEFNEWKKDVKQIDDILLLGIRF